nr:unnamed protein product [Spirometra erinaceieuropaei]
MKLRLKFRSSFVLINIENSNSELLHILELAAVHFKLNAANVELSLNANDFFGFDKATMRLDELGVVNGDILYMFQKLDAVASRFRVEGKCIGVCPAIIPLDIAATSKGLELHTDLNSVRTTVENSPDIVRLTYVYPPASSMPIVFTTFSVGDYISIAAGISKTSIANQVAINKKSNFVNCGLLDSDLGKNAKLMYKQPRDLVIRIMDELIEPALLRIHDELNLKPRLHLLRLPESVLSNMLTYLPLRDLSRVFVSCSCLHNHIRTSETIWRYNLARLEAKRQPVAQAALLRQQTLLNGPLSPETTPGPSQPKTDPPELAESRSSASITSELSLGASSDVNQDCPSFQKFLARYHSLASQRRYRVFTTFA